MVRVQWWILVKERSNLNEWHLYEACWNGKWRCNLTNLEQWLDISTMFFSFPNQKNTTNKSQINIFATYASRVKVNLDNTNASTKWWRMLVTLIKLYLQFFDVIFIIVPFVLIGLSFQKKICNVCVVCFNKNILLSKFIHVHDSWRVIINNLFCSTWFPIFSGHQALTFLHGM
jgi:hypothetical protein